MDPLLRELTGYVQETLGVDAIVAPRRNGKRLPAFLRERYRFAELRLLGTPLLLMIDRESAEQSPATVRKHLDLVRDRQDVRVVYVRDRVTAYNRKRLVDQRIPFIVPGNQMYLPPLGLDFRERFKRPPAERPALSPATQVLVLHALLHHEADVLVPARAAERLGYSRMTMTRAFDELEQQELGTVTKKGRERHLHLGADRRALWDKAQPVLRNPVTKRLTIQRVAPQPLGLVAGLAALAEQSMLAPPVYPIGALGQDDWKAVRGQQRVVELSAPDESLQEIEVWRYRPQILADGDRVDRLSLYLSLHDHPDERVAAALDEMMKELPW